MKEPVWIDERDALAIHDRLLALHGGAAGLRDANLLSSALARPRQHFGYAETPNIVGFCGLAPIQGCQERQKALKSGANVGG